MDGTDGSQSATILSVVESLYAAALSPDHHDAFQDQWNAYLAARNTGSAEPVDPILRHVETALTIIDRLQFSDTAALDPQSLVEGEPVPSAVIDMSGALVAANKSFRALLPSQAKTIWPLVSETHEQGDLKSALRRVHQVADARTQFLSFGSDTDAAPKLASIRQLPQATDAERQSALYKMQIGHPVWSPSASQFLIDTFAITPAEEAVLKGIVRGDRFTEIANTSKRSTDTIKAQSKSIYRKLGVSGREAAVRLILQLHLIMGPRPAKGTAGNSENLIILSSGRKIGFWERGAPTGEPFVFLHGMSLGHTMSPAFVQGLHERGLRAICVDRPGYRASDPPRDWRRSTEEWVNLFPELMDKLGLDRVPLVTHTTGVMYACAAAAVHPTRVSGICALAGGVPITDPNMLDQYPKQTKIIAQTARFSATALRFLITSGTAFFYRKSGAEKTIRRAYSGSSSDKAALDDPAIYELVQQSMTWIGQQGQGFDGFVGDGLKVFGDWSEFPTQMACKLTYVIGDEDPICPLEWARAFAQKHAHITVEPVVGAGQLLHHTHPDITLEHIADLCRPAR